jgi:Flp pilus assembly protein TadG
MPVTIRRKRQRGAELVESATILVVFVLLCVGIVDLGQFLYLQQSLTESVRSVARKSVVHADLTTDQVVNLLIYGTATRPPGVAYGRFGLTPSNVIATISDVNTNEQRLAVIVYNLPIHTVSPWLDASLKNIPIRVTIPLETP